MDINICIFSVFDSDKISIAVISFSHVATKAHYDVSASQRRSTFRHHHDSALNQPASFTGTKLLNSRAILASK